MSHVEQSRSAYESAQADYESASDALAFARTHVSAEPIVDLFTRVGSTGGTARAARAELATDEAVYVAVHASYSRANQLYPWAWGGAVVLVAGVGVPWVLAVARYRRRDRGRHATVE